MKALPPILVARPQTKHHRKLSLLLVVGVALVSVAWDLPDPSAGVAKSTTEMQAALDLRPTVRQSLGVRSAQAVGDRGVKLEIGASVTDAAGNAASYRIISFDDPNYAYKKFVRPVSAKAHKEVEAKGVDGSMQPEFFKTVVDLNLPEPMKPGAKYHVVAQGVDGTMVTAARAAATVAAGGSQRDPAIDQAVIGLRRVEPVGNGILLAEFGPGFSPKAGTNSDSYKVTVNGEPREITGMGRISRVDAYLPVGWPFKAIPVHEMFLQLAKPFQDGDKIRLEAADSVTGGNRVASLDFREAASFSPSIKSNQLGYLTDSPVKIAYLGLWLGDFPMKGSRAGGGGASEDAFWKALNGAKKEPATEAGAAQTPAPGKAADGGSALYFPEPPKFQLRAAEDGKVVFETKSRLVHRSGEMNEGLRHLDFSGENVYELDFTDFKKPGRYFISVPGVGRSQDFRIANDVFEQAFQVQSYGVFAQRSGFELDAPFSPWHRVASLMKGVVPTTLSRYAGERNAFQQLPKSIEREQAKLFVPPPGLLALNKDPALLAYWPMNGSDEDVSGHSRHLKPVSDKPDFVDAPEIMPDGNKAFGPTKPGKGNGFRLESLDLSKGTGVTFSLWVKVTNGIKYEGVLIGSEATDINSPRLQIIATWGAFRSFAGRRGEPVQIGRLNDGEWHHIALVLDRSKGDNGEQRFYLDGIEQGKSPAGTGATEAMPFLLANFTGDEPGGKFLDEIRVYSRPLNGEEIAQLARKWGESSNAIATSGGHHDAGDYNPRSHIEVAQILMNAYEMEPSKFRDGDLNLPESGNGIPDILDEAAWAMKLWPPLQNKDGGVRAGTESNGDPNFITTVELDTLGDFAFAPDAEASFQFAATFAQASRIWRGLGKTGQADQWLAMAEKAYQWAENNKPTNAKGPGELSSRYLAPKALAAAELLHTTGKANYNDDFLKVAVWKHQPDAEPDVYNLYDQQNAGWAYLKCPPEICDTAVQESIRRSIINRVDTFIKLCSSLAYKSYRHPYAPIGWGTAAYPDTIDPVLWSYELTKDPKYLEWIIRSVDNTLGTNPLGRSFITGLGGRTVRAPLHNSRFSHFGEVVPGMHVQGPNQKADGYSVKETAFPPIRDDFASLYSYVDAHYAIAMDEGTIPSMARCMALFGLLRPDATPGEKPAGPKK